MELVLQIKNNWWWPANLKVIQVNQVTKSQHLPFIVLFLALTTNFFILFDFFLLLIVISFVFIKRSIQIDSFLI